MKCRMYTDEEDIVLMADGSYKAWVQSSPACNVLNRRLGGYAKETDFVSEGSEGIFRFGSDQLKFVEAVLHKFP